jgi:hypothetical protein
MKRRIEEDVEWSGRGQKGKSRRLPRGTEENHDKTSVKVAGLRDEIRTRDFQNTKKEWLPLGLDVRRLVLPTCRQFQFREHFIHMECM